MEYFLIGYGILVVLGLVVFFLGIKKAVKIDSKQPFLNGDYDPDRDPTLKTD